jgi:hypothetical protein
VSRMPPAPLRSSGSTRFFVERACQSERRVGGRAPSSKREIFAEAIAAFYPDGKVRLWKFWKRADADRDCTPEPGNLAPAYLFFQTRPIRTYLPQITLQGCTEQTAISGSQTRGRHCFEQFCRHQHQVAGVLCPHLRTDMGSLRANHARSRNRIRHLEGARSGAQGRIAHAPVFTPVQFAISAPGARDGIGSCGGNVRTGRASARAAGFDHHHAALDRGHRTERGRGPVRSGDRPRLRRGLRIGRASWIGRRIGERILRRSGHARQDGVGSRPVRRRTRPPQGRCDPSC